MILNGFKTGSSSSKSDEKARLEASTILMPPTLFCTVLSPFKTIEMAWLNSSLAAGEIYVQIAAGKRVAVIEETHHTPFYLLNMYSAS